MKKKVILLLNTLIIFTISFLISSYTVSTNWTMYKQTQGVQIYYKTVDCDDNANGLFQKFVVFKIVNTTSFDVNISWKNELWYDNVCTTSGDKSKEHKVNLFIGAKSEIIGSCSNKKLQIFSEMKNHTDVPKLTKFELSELIIKPAL